MRVSNWNPQKFDGEIMTAGMDRLEKAAQVIASGARQRVPIDSGKLKNSIRVTRLKGDTRRNIRVYAGNRTKGGAYYAHMVEYGTVKMKAKPFLRPALNAAKSQIQGILRGGE
ncbi:MAG TPA: HK97 gp10 family phage protein [Smithellaceae bacterium]|jgi:HK97 gp10 family phage protein|nr:HK97 gp10 family phage protein [Smithellaceae bacterium]